MEQLFPDMVTLVSRHPWFQILALHMKMVCTIRLHPKPVTNKLELGLSRKHVLITLTMHNPGDKKIKCKLVSIMKRYPQSGDLFQTLFLTMIMLLKDKRSISPNHDKHISNEHGSIGTKSKSIIKPATYDGNSP